MRDFLLSIWDTRGGIFVLIALIAAIVYAVRYMAWLFNWGRFKAEGTSNASSVGSKADGKLAFVIADFFVKLINDFRHLLALILVSIFAGVLLFAIWRSNQTIDDLGKAIQSVTSALGGLIGSIIGYYFGESAGKKGDSSQVMVVSGAPPIQASYSRSDLPVGAPTQPQNPIYESPVTPAPSPPTSDS